MSDETIVHRGAIAVMAKVPRPGHVKTRFCPALSQVEAAELAECLLGDVLEATAEMAAECGLSAYLFIDPWSERESFASWLAGLGADVAEPFTLLPQQGDDLGERMGNAFTQLAARGHAPLLLRGSDSPGLGRLEVQAALKALSSLDLVVRPDQDGGYSLVGARRAPPADLFHHRMSHSGVVHETLVRAHERDLRVGRLPGGFDLDQWEDLRHLADLRARGQAGRCGRTLEFFDARGPWEPS